MLVLAAAALVVTTSFLASFGARPSGERLARISKARAWTGSRLANPEKTTLLKAGTLREMLRHQFFGKEVRSPEKPVPVVFRSASDFEVPPASGLRATWLGHASVFVEIGAARVLFDPIFSERCSPSRLVGPRRFHPPPITAAEIPKPDAVVISHDHYDHLDMESVKALAGRGSRLVVPLGIGAHLERWGIPPEGFVELDWDESATVGPLTLTALPSRHYSGRLPWRANGTLWAAWSVESTGRKVFFSGDTGPSALFAEVGATRGPFDLLLLKIGAYDATWPDIHMTPEEAARTYEQLGGRGLALPIHWATFNLAFHAWREPADRFVAAMGKSEAPGARFFVPKPGEMVDALAPPAQEAWWR